MSFWSGWTAVQLHPATQIYILTSAIDFKASVTCNSFERGGGVRIPKSKALYLSAAVFGLFGGSALTAGAAFKTVTVQTNGHQRVIRGFTFGSLKKFLTDKGAGIPEDARVNVDLSEPVKNNMVVDVTLPKHIQLEDGGHSTEIQTFANTVDGLFQEEGITVHPLDTVNVPLHSKLQDNEKVQIRSHRSESDDTAQVCLVPRNTPPCEYIA